MFCKNCGKEIPDTSKFCPECGSSVLESDSTRKNDDCRDIKNFKITPKKFKIAAHIALTLLAVFIWYRFCAEFYYYSLIPFLIGIFVILVISYNLTDSQISKRKERKRDKEAYRKEHPVENGFRIVRNIIVPILIVCFVGYGLYYAVNTFMKENNLEISTKDNTAGLVQTLYDDSFYVSAQGHVPIYFSTSGGKVNIKANSDRQVEFITMSKYDYENRISLLLGYEYYPDLSAKSVSMDAVGYLPAGDYVFVVQCVGLHINTRNVHVTIKDRATAFTLKVC